MEEALRRHVLSRVYLKGLTDGASKKSPLHVFDLKTGKHTQSRPPKVTGRLGARAFHAPGLDDQHLESALERFQGHADRVVQEVGVRRTLPTGEDFEVLVNYIALLLAGNPLLDSPMAEPGADPAQRAGALMVTVPRRLGDKRGDVADSDGAAAPAGAERIRQWLADHALTAEAARVNHVAPGFALLEAILPTLYNRQWFLIDAAKADAHFIGADWPAAVSWQRPEALPTRYQNRPGLAFSGTDVSLPLRHDLVLIGRFERPPKKAVAPDARLIAAINTRTALFAARYAFGSRRSFSVLDPAGHVVELAEAMASAS